MSSDGRIVPGQMFGRYQIVRVVGEGGMGVVYEAIHPALKKRFAVKTLLPSVAELPSVRARFLREGEATARIEHPHVVDVVDVGEQDGMPFLVMEFLEGQTLGDLLAARGRLQVAEALDLFLPALSAVAAGHAEGVVHRDLKPGNIFLARGAWGDRFPKVLDFGISKLIGDTQGGALTGTLTVLGTAAYMSPEQTRGAREIDGRSDQYSLGLILYEMLTGRRAHDGDHALEVLHNISNGVFKPPREVRPDISPAVEKILLRMLALDPTSRYRSLLEVGRALLPYASEKARVTLADAFPPETSPALRAAAAALAPASPARPLEPVASTTFRQAAAELSVADGVARPRRAGRAALVTFAAAAVLGAAGWVFIHPSAPSPTMTTGGPAPAPTASSPPSASPPPAPAPPPPIKEAPPLPPLPVAEPAPMPPAVEPPAAVKPARHVHRKKVGPGAHEPAAVVAPPAPAAPAADSPKRGANNALIIK